nr:MAG TPA: hypothetical protein [Caudoviricetes sp.]
MALQSLSLPPPRLLRPILSLLRPLLLLSPLSPLRLRSLRRSPLPLLPPLLLPLSLA